MLLSAGFSSCVKLGDKQQKPACATQVCTMEFRTIAIKFLDKDGHQITVDGYKSLDKRTNVVLHDNAVLVPGVYPPYYNVASDNDLSKLSDDGDDIEISGTNSVTGQTKTTVVKVSGGCNCHVSRISGPDSLKFD